MFLSTPSVACPIRCLSSCQDGARRSIKRPRASKLTCLIQSDCRCLHDCFRQFTVEEIITAQDTFQTFDHQAQDVALAFTVWGEVQTARGEIMDVSDVEVEHGTIMISSRRQRMLALDQIGRTKRFAGKVVCESACVKLYGVGKSRVERLRRGLVDTRRVPVPEHYLGSSRSELSQL